MLVAGSKFGGCGFGEALEEVGKGIGVLEAQFETDFFDGKRRKEEVPFGFGEDPFLDDLAGALLSEEFKLIGNGFWGFIQQMGIVADFVVFRVVHFEEDSETAEQFRFVALVL